MPKERRQRPGVHLPSVKLTKRHFVTSGQSEPVQVGQAIDVSGNDILNDLAHGPKIHGPLSKKEKQMLKHASLTRRLELSHSPHSKSHERRLKRKAKEQIAGGLSDLQLAISAIEKDSVHEEGSSLDGVTYVPSSKHKHQELGVIAEGRRAPLSKAQRRRVLQTERLRYPLTLSNCLAAMKPGSKDEASRVV